MNDYDDDYDDYNNLTNISFYTNNLKKFRNEFDKEYIYDYIQEFADEYDNSRSIKQIQSLHNQIMNDKKKYIDNKINNIRELNINFIKDEDNNLNDNKIKNDKIDKDVNLEDRNYRVYNNKNIINNNSDSNNNSNNNSNNDSDSDEEMDGGKFQSYDEKNYDNGILRKKDKLINKEKNIYSYKYIDAKNNKEITDEKTIERITKLRIPPKWDYVWISKDPNTEIQVIGHDDRGKKQYLYTTEHKQQATEKKFNNLSLLVSLIPKLNEVLQQDEQLGDYEKDKILSTITRIILITGIRAGKEFHVTRNNSYGITSLRKKHIKFDDNKKHIIFKFKGKSNVIHTHIIKDEYIYNHLKKIYNLKLSNDEDDKLFLYYDKQNKEVKKIDEFDLNNYLHAKIHPDIVIKDLRTYIVNYLLVSKLLNKVTLKITKQSKAKQKKFIKSIIEEVADYIQHTPSICKNSYIYPPIIDKFFDDPNFFLSNHKKDPYDILKLLTNN